MTSPNDTHVFISYAHKDGAELAQRLCQDLQTKFDVWLDKDRLTGGSTWSQEIEDNLDRSDVVLVLLSAGSFASEVCRGEQLRSLRHNKCVIPLSVQADADRPVYLEAKQYVDFSEDATYSLRLEALEQAIKGRTGATLAPGFKTTRYDTVPPLPQNFVPRPAESEALRQAVLSDREQHHVRLLALRGMGGIGKTVLAQALCRDEAVQAAFPDGVAWIKIGERPSEADLVNQMREAARAIGCSSEGFDTLDHSSNLLRSLIKDKMALLVLDDVWDAGPVYHFQPPDDARFSRLLFTTRNDEVAATIGAQSQPLDILDEQQSRHLLATYAGREESDLPEEASGILHECHGLPLALAMVGAMLRNKSPQVWGDVLDSLRSADLDEIKLKFPNYAYPSLVAAIETSVNHLEDDEKKCYLDFAVFPHDTAVPDAALEVAWALEGKKVRKIKDHLVSLSLATRDDSDRITLHDLQLDYVRKCAGSSLPELHSRFLDRYKLRCSDGWHTGPDDGYFFEHLAYHLKEAGQLAELRKLLFDYSWLQGKLGISGLAALISDFDVALGSREGMADKKSLGRTIGIPPWRIVEAGSTKASHSGVSKEHDSDELLRLLQGALRLSAHAFARDAAQLPSQLCGRLASETDAETQSLLDRCRACTHAWLRPIRGTLTPPGGPQVRMLTGHRAGVLGVAVTPDGRLAVSASYDQTLKVWELGSGRELRTLSGHSSGVSAVAVTPDGQLAVSASWDQTLKVWELGTGRDLRTLSGHASSVNAVAVTPDGQRAVSAQGYSLKVWDLGSGRELRTLSGHTKEVNAVAVTPDGQLAVSASWDKTLKVWDLGTGRELHTLSGHTDVVFAVAVTLDGQLAVSASADRTLKVWDLGSGRELRTLSGHTNSVSAVAITPDSQQAVSASYDRTLKVWELASGRELRTLSGHASNVRAVAVTPDGQQAVSASWDDTLKVWVLGSGRELRTVSSHLDPVTDVVMTADGQLAMSASKDRTLKVWELSGGRELRAVTLSGHTSSISAVAVTPDGRLAVSASYDQTLKVWDLGSGREVHTLSGHTIWVNAVAVTPDGRLAISASADRTLKVWDLGSGRELRTLSGHSNAVSAVAVTPDGQLAVSASYDRTLKVWDLGSGRELRTLSGHSNAVSAVAVTPDGQLAVSASYDRTLKVWDLTGGREVRTLSGHTDVVNAVAVTPDGKLALSASDDHTLKVWELGSCHEPVTFTADASLSCCAFSPDGKTIMAGDQGGAIHYLRLEQPQAKANSNPHA